MKPGDLVKIRGTSIVALVTRIESVDNYYDSITTPTEWAFLAGKEVPLKASKLEVINESR